MRFLDGKIATTGELEDGASDELHAVRQEIRRRNEQLQKTLDALLSRPEVARALQDSFISIRSERHVVPIRAEAQDALQGIVHGVSGSGATVFVEPIETVDLNNQIVTLRDREAAEIQRLLQEYSDLLRGRLAEIRKLSAGIGDLDLLSARARIGRRLGAVPGEISRDGALRLSAARHASLPVFRGIFIHIGDHQSIPDGLSTFSARMKNIAGIFSSLEAPALVLLDEIGTGTDPEDGVALAIAIVEELRRAGACVCATTHLEALKAYAATTSGCANAAMQMDESTCTPTYRLVRGIPGRSGGLEIAERLGLPPAVLRAAREARGHSGERVASYLSRLQDLSAEWERRLEETRAEKIALERERAALTKDFEAREERRRKTVVAEIEHALKSLREEGDRYLKTIEDRKLALAMRRQETRAAADLRATARTLLRSAENADGVQAPVTPQPLAAGRRVTVTNLGVRGTVESIRGDRAVVLVRGKRMTVSARDCVMEREGKPESGEPLELPRGVTLARRPGPEAADEIHLLGKTVEEAREMVDKYLDEVYVAGRSPVRLIHGVGSGRLKKAISDLLARHPHVAEYASAPAAQGGAGVTIVTLRL